MIPKRMSNFQRGANWDKAREIVKEHREYLASATGFDLADKQHHAYEGLIARIAIALAAQRAASTPTPDEIVAMADRLLETKRTDHDARETMREAAAMLRRLSPRASRPKL